MDAQAIEPLALPFALPFALSLSKGDSWFDRLTTNGSLSNPAFLEAGWELE
jgi:hypothetical protein